MHDEHAGPRALHRVVVNQEARERGVALLVFDGFRVDRRLHNIQAQPGERDGEQSFHARILAYPGEMPTARCRGGCD